MRAARARVTEIVRQKNNRERRLEIEVIDLRSGEEPSKQNEENRQTA